jgi:hypothetical protein
LHDVLGKHKDVNETQPSWRKLMLLGGYFILILHVVPKKIRVEIVYASFTSSSLLPKFNILTLK